MPSCKTFTLSLAVLYVCSFTANLAAQCGGDHGGGGTGSPAPPHAAAPAIAKEYVGWIRYVSSDRAFAGTQGRDGVQQRMVFRSGGRNFAITNPGEVNSHAGHQVRLLGVVNQAAKSVDVSRIEDCFTESRVPEK